MNAEIGPRWIFEEDFRFSESVCKGKHKFDMNSKHRYVVKTT